MAAVLACGSGAVLSYRSAAALWRIRPSARGRIDVTLPRSVAARPGIEPHRCRIRSDETTVESGIPVTTAARTLLDLASVLDRRQVARAWREVDLLELAGALSVADLVGRHPRRRGTHTIGALLADRQIGIAITRSELEDRFLEFLRSVGVPRPQVNVPVEGLEVDCVWRGHGLIAELDGRRFHRTHDAFERDRARDRVLQTAGWRVIRITWRQLHLQPERLASDLNILLRRSPLRF